MLARLLRRLAATLLLVVGVSSGAFLVTRLSPGDVVQTTMGFGASQATIARAQHRIGLDRPLVVQWGAWLAGVVRLDLGTSALYAERALNTALLATVAFLVAFLLGIPPAFITATRPRSPAAHVIRAASLVLLSLPPFVGSLALVLVAARTGWFPAGGMTTAEDVTGVALLADVLWHLPLPVAALALPLAATFERLQAQALTEALEQPAILAARARGIPESTIVRRHAWRLALKPVAAVAGLIFGALLSGSFVVEMVTAWPGLGRLTYDALLHRDLELVAGCAAAGALVLSVGLLLADMAIAWSDPRVRAQVASEVRA